MSKAARGTKRVCHSCGAKFYDLNNHPIHCPACSAEFKISKQAAHGESRSEEVREQVTPAKAPRPVAPIVDLDLDLDPELATVDDEDLVSLDDVEEPDTGDDEDEAFLPEEDEGEDDVSGFIGESLPKVDDEI